MSLVILKLPTLLGQLIKYLCYRTSNRVARKFACTHDSMYDSMNVCKNGCMQEGYIESVHASSNEIP